MIESSPDVTSARAASATGRPLRINAGPADFVTYRGGAGMYAWLLHRLTGIGVLVFVILHVIDTAMIGWGPAAYNHAMALYRQTGFRIGEMLLFGAVLYHALNGIRITVMDFWPETSVIQKGLFRAVVIVFVVFYIPALVVMALWMR